MKKTFWLLGVVFLALAFLSAGKNTGMFQEASPVPEEYVPNEVLVKFKEEAGKYLIQAGIDAVQGKVITHLKKEISALEWDPDSSSLRSFLADPYLVHIKVPEAIGTEGAISFLSLNPNVEYAERNGIFRLFVIPNDDHFSKL
jgi:hypothetical protein